MCGLVGIINKFNAGFYKVHEDVFFQGLYCDVLRGEDSTGVLYVEKDTSMHLMKDVGSGAYMADIIRASDKLKNSEKDGKVLFGHNRKKTVGAVDENTAHPFVINDDFALMHNGTLSSYTHLAKDALSDSHALAQHLAPIFDEEDLVKGFEEKLSKVYGAYALAMYSQKQHKAVLTRNNERPLAIAETINGWFFASEIPMLHWLLLRNGVAAKDISIEIVDPNKLYIFDLDTNKMSVEELQVKKATPATGSATSVGNTTTLTNRWKKGSKPTLTSNPKFQNWSTKAFHQFRKKLLLTTVTFRPDDYVESNFPRTFKEGETEVTLMGTLDCLKHHRHTVNAIVDLRDNQDIDPSWICEEEWVGKIDEMLYNPHTGFVTVLLENAKLKTPFKITQDTENEAKPLVH